MFIGSQKMRQKYFFCMVLPHFLMLPENSGRTTIHVVTRHGMWKMVTARQENMFAKRIGKALAKERLARNLTQEQVAEFISVEQETISRFERGATLPPLLRLIDLADLFNVPLDTLVRAGSARPLDQAIDIAAALTKLNEEDRGWVREWLVEMCQKLSART
ncbi:MAG: helix-turn-helix transcriptional regulator [Pseudomonadota bacterium]